MPPVSCSVCQSEVTLELGHLAAAACGHTFHSSCLNEWLQKGTKTCPVCRKPTKSSLALFIDFVAEEDASDSSNEKSSNVLRCRIESLEFQLKLREEEKKKAEEKAIVLEQNKRDLRNEAKRLESKFNAENDRCRSLESQIQYVTKELSSATGFRDEARKLKVQNESLKSAKLILQGTESDVEDILSSYMDKSDEMRSLATYSVMLKKELMKSQDSKGTRLEELNRIQKENSVLRSRLRVAEKRVEELETDMCKLDSENMRLQKKIDQYRGKRRAANPFLENSSISLSDRTMDTGDCAPQKKTKKNKDENLSPPEPMEVQSHIPLEPLFRHTEPLLNQPSGSHPSSSQGPSKSDISLSTLGIMKKRPVLNAVSPRKNMEDCDVGFDGLGGSSRPDVFPVPKGPSKTFLKNSVKIKSGNKVKMANITEFITLE